MMLRTKMQREVVISCASSIDLLSYIAIVEGLGIQKKASGQYGFSLYTRLFSLSNP
jgi:hypothetical protein